jgi:Uma2 family endonuclease
MGVVLGYFMDRANASRPRPADLPIIPRCKCLTREFLWIQTKVCVHLPNVEFRKTLLAMSIAVANTGMTTEELLELPQNGTDRWLIRGELREKPLTVRNRFHSKIMANVTTELGIWLRSQGQPHGELLCGEAGVRLRHNPDTTVGIDVVYISAEVAVRQSGATTLIDGVPILAVEILSPSDTLEETHEKIVDYLAVGVAVV